MYVFAKQEGMYFTPLYIGKSGDLSYRLPDHERLPCVVPLGCTHVCVMFESYRIPRTSFETDSIDGCDPPCNG